MGSTIHPLFTIGITTYNRRKLLSECLQSILSQSFGDYEVLIGNDYVSDKLKLEDFDIVDDRFRITNHNENLGEISNMNWLLNNANGKYFTWLADDDVFHHDYLSIMHEIIGKSNAIALFSNYIAAPSIPSEFFNPISTCWIKS